MEYPIDNPVWKVYFGSDILECRWAWRAKKERLARQNAALYDLGESASDSDVDRMDIDDLVTPAESPTPIPSEQRSVSFSDKWVSELDQIFLNINKYLEDLQLEMAQLEMAQQGSQDHHSVLEESSNNMANMQDGLTRCLAVLQNGKSSVPVVDDNSEDSVMVDFDSLDASINSDSASTTSLESHTTASSFAPTSPEFHSENGTVASFSGLSPGEIVMKFLMRWWGPRGSCARDTKRIAEDRVTEVDGLIH